MQWIIEFDPVLGSSRVRKIGKVENNDDIVIVNNTDDDRIAVCLPRNLSPMWRNKEEAARQAMRPSFDKPTITATPYEVPNNSKLKISRQEAISSNIVLYDYLRNDFTSLPE